MLRVFIRCVIPEQRWTGVWQDQYLDRLKVPLNPDAPLSALDSGFVPEADDLVVIKQRYSAAAGIELAGLLRAGPGHPHRHPGRADH